MATLSYFKPVDKEKNEKEKFTFFIYPIILLTRAMLAVIPCLVAASATAPQPPNVLFIVGDDVGYSDFGYFNDQQVKTIIFLLAFKCNAARSARLCRQ